MTPKFEQHIPIDASGRKAIEWLALSCAEVAPELSRAELKAVMQKGAVWLTRQGSTQRLRRASRLLNSGDELHLYYDPQVLNQPLLEPQLIADEGDYSVWNKPTGMLCQGSKYGDQTTLYRWAETRLQPERPAFIVHRLDRATRGLILLAHNKRSAQRLSALFETRQVDKHYRAVVKGCLQLEDALIDTPVDGKAARSRITTLAVDTARNCSLIEVKLETGRKHQIRVHLLGLGHPVLGDRFYATGVEDGCDLQLQSFFLAFPWEEGAVEYRLTDAQLLNL
ncbi:MAG: tRNA pseudouridine32 synthase/23S rRNA pseudouridine746 synthase [Motiliproteus sp.]|jgi:tRNA pseudouridine32 synthase/23S rRNA pseudouridine746 synthase